MSTRLSEPLPTRLRPCRRSAIPVFFPSVEQTKFLKGSESSTTRTRTDDVSKQPPLTKSKPDSARVVADAVTESYVLLFRSLRKRTDKSSTIAAGELIRKK